MIKLINRVLREFYHNVKVLVVGFANNASPIPHNVQLKINNIF